MKILVTLKRVPDPEQKVKFKGSELDLSQASWVLNTFDEYAVETALRLNENAGSGEKNTLSISYDASLNEYRLVDTTAPVSGGPGCGAIDDEIDCGAAGVTAIVIYLRLQARREKV